MQKSSLRPYTGSVLSNLGIFVYAAGAIFLGLLGLASGDFATAWQHVNPNVPFRTPLAYLTAAIELSAGLALLWRRTARAGALTLTAIYAAFAVAWVPAYLAHPRAFDPLGNFFEEFSLAVGGGVLAASLSPSGSPLARRESLLARLYGLPAISFGVGHICSMPGLLTWVPGWLPPSRMFWVYVTTIGFFLAAAAILAGVMDRPASRLITAEILGFEILIWLPKLVAGPRGHFIWAANAISIAIVGATWAVADSIGRAAKRARRGAQDGRLTAPGRGR
jgi:uncharacterized membrane protein YphA (DoxX/SURF4 family)